MNDLILVIRALARGTLPDRVREEEGCRPGPPVEQREENERELLRRWRRRVEVFVAGRHSGAGLPESAFGRLTCMDEGDMQAQSLLKGRLDVKRVLKRGDICPLDVESVALPDGSREPIQLVNISKTCRKYLVDIQSMLKTEAEITYDDDS